MSSRSQRPLNPPPPGHSGHPGEGSAYQNYRPNGDRAQAPPLAPPVPSTSAPASTSNNKPPPLTLEQSRQVARTHYDALKQWLNREGALGTATTRTNARDKLTRLTRQQFQELSTDVYDELVRRIEDAAGRPGEQPFLAVRPDFHPKRNQARQKLATLPLQRFKDLASDVYFELDRRYPEFGDEDSQQSRAPSRSDSLSSSHNRHNAPSPTPPPNLNAQRRAPTPNSSSQPRSPTDQQNPPPPTPAAPTSNEVVVPNKSTMVVEEPSGNFTTQPRHHDPSTISSSSASASGLQSPPALSPTTSSHPRDLYHDPTTQRSSPTTAEPFRATRGGGGPDELSPLQNQQPSFTMAPGGGGGGGPFKGYAAGGGGGGQHQSRVSEVSSVGTHSKFFGGYAGSATGPPSEAGARRSNEMQPWGDHVADDHSNRQQAAALEKVRSDYEYKLTVLHNRVAELERENEDAASALRGRATSDESRVRDLEGQLRGHQQRYEDQTGQLRMVQREFDALQQRHQQVQRENEQLGSDNANAMRAGGGSGDGRDATQRARDLEAAEDLANELRGEVSSLVDELRQVNERCEDLQLELDQERRAKEDKDREAREWKDKWQAAKTELRNIKATSQLFTSTINVERDFMPASNDGLVNDTSIASFQTSIDDLLEAARSKEPSSIISHARLVVSAVEKIDRDVQAIPPSRFDSLSLQDQDIVNSLKAKINATLSNLMTASKNHATSFGVSPVSLLDAAASHLASTIVELVRILKIRKTSGGHPTRSGSLDPSTASSRFNREPMPPLPEGTSSSMYRPAASSPPSQSREVPSSSTSPPSAARSNGYVSGGVSSLVSSSTAGMRNALEAMGIASSSSASRSSLEKDRESLPEPPRPLQHRPDEEPVSSPQSDYGTQQQYHSFSNSRPQQQSSNSFGAGAGYQSSVNERDQFNQYRHDDYDGQRPEQQYDDGHPNDARDYVSPSLHGQETNVDELRSYIENQTEAIVHSIQSLLSAIRSGSQGEQLNENLTQIITIVSSIVAISKDALPTTTPHAHGGDARSDAHHQHHHRDEGESILADLTDHCDKLSEMQSETGAGQAFTKQTKQAMATASFGVAKSLKQLNGLFATVAASSSSLSDQQHHHHGGEAGLV